MQTKPFLYLSLLAAGAAHSETLTGRLLSPDGAAPHRLRVNLLTAGEKQQIEQTKPSRSGDFAISCPPGSYVLEVLNPKGRLMRRLPVRVPAPSPVEIDLRPRFEPATGANLVSFKRLRHQVPAQAEERFAAAHDAALAGNTEAAIAHLEAAIALDPDYFEALHNLAVHYANLNRLNEAKPLLERATNLEPQNALAELNLILVSVRLGQTPSPNQLAAARRLLTRLGEKK